jgi:hypothetical protein
MSTSSQSGQGAISNILAVAGFIILIAIIVWGAYHFLEIASSGISSLFGKRDAVQVTLSKSVVKSGESFTASWTYAPESAGVYTVLYQCQEGVVLRNVTGNGIVTAIPCGAAYPLGNETAKSAQIVPSTTGNKSLDVTLNVIFNPITDPTSTSTSTATRPQGSAKVTIQPQTETTTQPTSQPSTQSGTQTKTGTTPTQTSGGTKAPTPTTSSAPKPQVSGKPDLVVQIVAVGVIDPYTGAFVGRSPISPEEIVAVKFDIANRGTASTGAWHFSAELPIFPPTPYNSPRQAPLSPGSHIENTLRFTQTVAGGGMFAVTVDSSNATAESNESNNTAALWISGPMSGYPYEY